MLDFLPTLIMVKENYKSKLDGNDLDLSLMSLTEIPVKEIAALPKATQIDLSCNHISSIPVQFCNLKLIVKLDLSRNEIAHLPEAFGDLHKLQYLDLYNNKLQMLPVSFCRLQNLKWLDLKNNPLTSHLKKIAGDCLDAKQCQNCAKNVVQFMQNVQNQVLAEQEMDRKQQEELAAQRKIQEDLEYEAQRKAKKAAKERKRAALLAEKQERQMRLDSFSSDSGISDKTEINLEALKQARKIHEYYSGKGRMSWGAILMQILFSLFMTASFVFCMFYFYTNGDFSEASIRLAYQEILKDSRNLLADVANIGRKFFVWLQTDGVHIMKIIFSYCNTVFWDAVEIMVQVWNHFMDKVAVFTSDLKAA